MRAIAITSLLAVLLAHCPAWAAATSPVGLWRNIDDATGKPKALIRISEKNGALEGRIEKLFLAPQEDPQPKCTRCSGARKDQPVIGMVMMSGLKKDGAEYTGGEILDPANGKVYRSKLKLAEGGRQLEVRGYIGVPMLGRSQTWVREAE